MIDAVAIGQFTPGSVLSTTTFIGGQVNGFLGAMEATFGIFIPLFLLVAILNPIIPKMRKPKIISAFLDAINVGAVAVIVAVAVEMGRESLTDLWTFEIAFISLVFSILFKLGNISFIVIGGAALGYLLIFFLKKY